MDPIREAVQKYLDDAKDGWTCSAYFVAVGLERFGPNGELEFGRCWIAPGEQAEWVSSGLIESVVEARESAEEVNDDD